jgi:hypothetical protein
MASFDFTVYPATSDPRQRFELTAPGDLTEADVIRAVEPRLSGPATHLRFGRGANQLSILHHEAAVFAGEPINAAVTNILRHYLRSLNDGEARPKELTPTIHGTAIVPDRPIEI